MKSKILIVVVTDVEYQAVKEKMLTVETNRSIGDILVEEGEFSGQDIFLCKMNGMGSKAKGSVGDSLTQVIADIHPSIIVELGICFSLKKGINIGDVCISKSTYDYESQKIHKGQIQFRSKNIDCDGAIIARFENFKLNSNGSYGIKIGSFVCGEKVVDDAVFKKQLNLQFPDAIAGDMESYTLGLICAQQKKPWVVIKGVSDSGTKKGDEFQKLAADNAVDMLYRFIENNSIPDMITHHLEISNEFNALLCEQITRIITQSETFPKKDINQSRMGYYLHFHPVMGSAWVILYIYKAESLPQVFRKIADDIKDGKNRIEVCVISRQIIISQKIESYKNQLIHAGFKSPEIKTIKPFVFEQLVKKLIPESGTPSTPNNYIDQQIFIAESNKISSRSYIRDFINNETPISVIVGEGGVGKTTLCRRIAANFKKLTSDDQHLLLVTKSDIVRSHNKDIVNSISDLYREYCKNRAQQVGSQYDSSFDLALSCGSIVMIIDGIDEIESALEEKFDMQSFVESIESLNEILGACRVILTSRNYGVERFKDLENIEIAYLKGFSNDDVDAYLGQSAEHIAKQVRRILHKLVSPSGFINPYLLSVAVQVFSEPEIADIDFESVHKLDPGNPFEYILARSLGREIEKQSLGISIDDYYEFLEHIAVDNGNNISKDDFMIYITTMLNTGSSSAKDSLLGKYMKYFMLEETGDRVRISHEEFVSLIRLKSISSIFTKKTEILEIDINRIITSFSSDHDDALGIRDSLVEKLNKEGFNKDHFIEMVKHFLFKLKERSPSTDRIKKTIYSLYRMAIDVRVAKGAAECGSVIKELNDGSRINSMYIYGSFPAIDFSGMTIEKSDFIGYEKLSSSKFDQNSKFISCRFISCHGNKINTKIDPAIFDTTCFIDEETNNYLASADEKRQRKQEVEKADLKSIIKSMKTGYTFEGKSINRIKMSSKLLSGKSFESFLQELCDKNILMQTPPENLYKLNLSLTDDAMTLCDEGILRGELYRLFNGKK